MNLAKGPLFSVPGMATSTNKYKFRVADAMDVGWNILANGQFDVSMRHHYMSTRHSLH
jgi:hypothetical protein